MQPPNWRAVRKTPVTTFNEETKQLDVFQPAVIGRSLSMEKTLNSISESLNRGEHRVELAFDSINPQHLDQASAKEMGITELVGSQTTYFYGSDAARIQNITAAAARFHGVLVAPGETFSIGRPDGRRQPGYRLRRSLDHLRRPHHKGCWRGCLPGQHDPLPHGFLRRLSRGRALPARLPCLIL